jgi:hypothetical protein
VGIVGAETDYYSNQIASLRAIYLSIRDLWLFLYSVGGVVVDASRSGSTRLGLDGRGRQTQTQAAKRRQGAPIPCSPCIYYYFFLLLIITVINNTVCWHLPLQVVKLKWFDGRGCQRRGEPRWKGMDR